jgi:transposase
MPFHPHERSVTNSTIKISFVLIIAIETTKADMLEPYSYLRFKFEKLPTATSLEEYKALLPWNVKISLI